MATDPTEEKPTRRQKRDMRMLARVEKWEARKEGPPPPRYIHRVIISVLMMLFSLWLVYLLTVGPS